MDGRRQKSLCSGKKKKKDIILDQVRSLVQEHPDCRVYHSLGGALATLFALEAAADSQIPHPVTCITSGSTKVGNVDFLRVFESFGTQWQAAVPARRQRPGPVTLSPPNGALNPINAILCQRRRFRHVGLRLKLHEHGYVITFPPKAESYCGILSCVLMKVGRACGFVLVLAPHTAYLLAILFLYRPSWSDLLYYPGFACFAQTSHAAQVPSASGQKRATTRKAFD